MRSGVAHSQRRRGAAAGYAQSSRRLGPAAHSASSLAEKGRAQAIRLHRDPGSLFDGLGGEPTLDEVLAGAWEGLTAHSVVACPVCGDDMQPEYGAHSLPISGKCIGCGTTIS